MRWSWIVVMSDSNHLIGGSIQLLKEHVVDYLLMQVFVILLSSQQMAGLILVCVEESEGK